MQMECMLHAETVMRGVHVCNVKQEQVRSCYINPDIIFQ